MHLVRASPGARPPHVVRRAELWCTTDAGTVAPTPPRTSESRASPMRNTHPSIRAHKTASASTSKPTEAKRGRAIEIVGAAARWHRWVSWDRGLHQHKMQDDLWLGDASHAFMAAAQPAFVNCGSLPPNVGTKKSQYCRDPAPARLEQPDGPAICSRWLLSFSCISTGRRRQTAPFVVTSSSMLSAAPHSQLVCVAD